DLTRAANYRVETRNYIVAPQLGIEYGWCPFGECLPGVALGFTAKGAWGVNFIEYRNRLTRGDGIQAFNTSNNATAFAHLYEVGGWLDIALLEKLRLRGGYQAIWLLNIANVQDQVDLNFANVEGPRKSTGDIFLHGPFLELQFLF